MPAIRPHLLTIGAQRLRTKHVRPRYAATLLDGYDHAVRLLDCAQSLQPTVIVLHLAATEPGFPEFAAPQLAAVLTRRMQIQAIHPASLIGLATDPAPALVAEAEVAGCQFILPPPRTDEQWQALFRLTRPPIPLRAPDRATEMYQRAAERVLAAVHAAQITIWTAGDVAILLGYLTRYPVEDASPVQARRVLRVLGGYELASQHLYEMVEAWRIRFPLYAEVLRLFLAGWERREIVHFFVSRDLYEDSRIYACIKRLPEHIAQELRLTQARKGDYMLRVVH